MNIKKTASVIATLILISACSQPEESAPPAQNVDVQMPGTLDKAVAAIGGEQLLLGMNAFTTAGSGKRYELDESPVPGGVDPRAETFDWTINAENMGDTNVHVRIDISRDRAAGVHASSLVINGSLGMISGRDSQFNPAPSSMSSDRRAAILKELYLLQPQAVLSLALSNPAAVQESSMMMDNMNYEVLAVPTSVGTISLYVAEDGMIRMATVPEYDYLRGDLTLEATYAEWKVSNSGMLFPASVILTEDGIVLHEETRRSLNLNSPLQMAAYEIPLDLQGDFDQALHEFGANSAEVYLNMASAGFPRAGFSTEVAAQELAPGVFFIGGSSHNSLLVEQENGLVIIEAPLHYRRSQAVIDWIKNNMPDKPITHVFVTHHHTDHSAGIRTYVDAGASVVAHEAAVDFYRDILSRPNTLGLGSAALDPASLQIIGMPANASFTLADDSIPVSVYPLNSDGHAQDMVMIYVEEPGILFTSDTFSPNPNMTELDAGAELVGASIEAAGIEPTMYAGGHGAVMSGEAFRALFD